MFSFCFPKIIIPNIFRSGGNTLRIVFFCLLSKQATCAYKLMRITYYSIAVRTDLLSSSHLPILTKDITTSGKIGSALPDSSQ